MSYGEDKKVSGVSGPFSKNHPLRNRDPLLNLHRFHLPLLIKQNRIAGPGRNSPLWVPRSWIGSGDCLVTSPLADTLAESACIPHFQGLSSCAVTSCSLLSWHSPS